MRHWPRSSPDGDRIAFLMRDDSGVEQLWLITPNGGEPTQLTHNRFPIESPFTWRAVAGRGLLGLFLLGRLSPRVRGPHAAVAVVVGVLVILWMTFSPMKLWPAELAGMKSPFHGFLTIVFGTLSILIVGATLALLSPSTPKRQHQPELPPR